MTRRLRIAALAAVAALAIAGCANNDAKRSDVVNAMTDAGLDQDQADCIGDGIDGAFRDNQDLYNDVASAVDEDELNELPDDAAGTVNRVLEDCLGGGSGGGDTTDTTAAGGDGATTTETTAAG